MNIFLVVVIFCCIALSLWAAHEDAERLIEIAERLERLEKDDKFKDKVECETCKCWLDKKDAFVVTDFPYPHVEYYCFTHKKPYSMRQILLGSTIKYFIEKKVEVDVNGKEIKLK